MLPWSMSIRSTAPSSPANVVQVGVPSRAASRFMVPPALTTRSAAYTSDGPSTGLRGHHDTRHALEAAGLLRGPRQEHHLGVAGPQVGEHVIEQGVVDAPVIEAHGGRWPEHGDGPGSIEPQRVDDRRVGLEVGQGHLLLDARIRSIPSLVQAQCRQRGPRDDLGHHDLVREPEVDLVHRRGALEIVEHRAVQPEQLRGDRQIVGAVADGLPDARGGAPEPGQRERPSREAGHLAAEARPAVTSDDRVGDAVQLQQPQGLGEVPRGDRRSARPPRRDGAGWVGRTGRGASW